MGYRSNVAIEIQGKKDSVHLLLKTYAMSETPEQIEAAHHILGPTASFYDPPQKTYDCYTLLHRETVINHTETYLTLVFEFEDVKWYTESQTAFERLLDVADNLRAADGGIEIGIFFRRVGEDTTDMEQDSYFDYDTFDPVTSVAARVYNDLPQSCVIDAEHFIKTLEPSGTNKTEADKQEDVTDWNDMVMAIERKAA